MFNSFNTREFTRRELFKTCMGGILIGFIGQGRSSASSSVPGDDSWVGVLVDLTRCIGCRACENACITRRGQSPLPATDVGYGPGEKRLSHKTWTFVDFIEVKENAIHTLPVKKQCMHCVDPACSAVCPVSALEKTPMGSVVYWKERCIGCRYCLLACPFDIPRFEWDSGLFPRVGKCDFCSDRLASGFGPACVNACPAGALKFGKREKILEEAKGRRRVNPQRYSTLYGDEVVGGTSWIYLSDTPMEKLGFREGLPQYPLPTLTSRVLSKVPFVIVGLGLVLSVVSRLRSRGNS